MTPLPLAVLLLLPLALVVGFRLLETGEGRDRVAEEKESMPSSLLPRDVAAVDRFCLVWSMIGCWEAWTEGSLRPSVKFKISPDSGLQFWCGLEERLKSLVNKDCD